jgi:DNA-binding MarR family transcriptional regulator
MSTRALREAATPAPRRQLTLGFLLRELYEALQRDIYAAVAADGHPEIREVHSPVLRYITAEGARVSDVARRCGYAKQSIAYVVDDLAQLGYVTVEPDPDDGRAKRVRLTPRGEDLIACLVAHSQAAERSLARKIGSRPVAELRAALGAAVTAGGPGTMPGARAPSPTPASPCPSPSTKHRARKAPRRPRS